jgi:hypothetical protein
MLSLSLARTIAMLCEKSSWLSARRCLFMVPLYASGCFTSQLPELHPDCYCSRCSAGRLAFCSAAQWPLIAHGAPASNATARRREAAGDETLARSACPDSLSNTSLPRLRPPGLLRLGHRRLGGRAHLSLQVLAQFARIGPPCTASGHGLLLPDCWRWPCPSAHMSTRKVE